MISSLSAAIPQSGGSSFPKDIFLFEEIKSLVEAQIRKTGIPKRFKPRLYTYTDYILPILYALKTRLSIHQACEELNTLFISHMEQSHGIKMKTYVDGIRKRRLIPH